MSAGARGGEADPVPGAASPVNDQNTRGVRLSEQGRIDEAIATFREVVRLNPDFAPAHFNLGNALMAVQCSAEACRAYRRALASEPDFARGHLNLGLALLDSGELEGAVHALARAHELDPRDTDAVSALAVALIRRDELGEALDVLEGNLARRPHDSRDLSLVAVACARLGHHERTRQLLDFDRLVLVHRPVAPTGYVDVPAFNSALAEHLLEHASLRRAPVQHATRGGRHSGELLLDSAPAIAALRDTIEHAVEHYVTGAAGGDPHPFHISAPQSVTLTAWAIVLDSGGYQIPHVHPAGWLSGVYYVSVPEPGADRPHEGAIELGRPDPELAGRGDWPTRVIDPSPGSMVLFPSYIYHRTLPFSAPGPRISVAFDVIRD